MDNRITFQLRTYDFDNDAALDVQITVSSQKELSEVKQNYGGGALVKAEDFDKQKVTDVVFDALEEGQTYVLRGGKGEAATNNKLHNQINDRVLEEMATEVMLREGGFDYGRLELFTDYEYENKGERNQHQLLRKKGSPPIEIDGMGVNGTIAVLVEVKHSAVAKHIDMVKQKAKYVESVAEEGQVARLHNIKKVVPVLASNFFTEKILAQCKSANVGIIKQNGDHYSFAYRPRPVLSRALHTASLALRFLRR